MYVYVVTVSTAERHEVGTVTHDLETAMAYPVDGQKWEVVVPGSMWYTTSIDNTVMYEINMRKVD